MKEFLDIVRNLLEAEDNSAERSNATRGRATRYMDPDDGIPDLDFSPRENLGNVSKVDHDDIPEVPHPTSHRAPPGHTASGARTRATATSFASPEASQQAAHHLSHLHAAGLDQDEIDDIEAFRLAGLDDDDVEMIGHRNATPLLGNPDEVTPETLPAIMAHALAVDNQVRDPEWHMVKNLPGYLQNGIRSMGHQVFAPFTTTPIEKLQVLSTLSNPEDDVKFMMQWIVDNGVKNDEAELVFHDMMPGYAAQTQIYDCCGSQFMLVKDFAGYYIYGWSGASKTRLGGPETETGNASLPGQPRRLR